MRFKRIDFTCGSSDFPTGTGETEVNFRIQKIVKGLADALIGMSGLHWVIDTDYCSSTSDFKDVPDSYNNAVPSGLFLKNTSSGCKLFIAYMTYYSIQNFSGSDICQIYNETNMSGVVVSMIPGGSNNVFGSSFNSSFLPADATRFIGTSSNGSYCYNPEASYVYSWGIFATDYVIAIGSDRSNSGNRPDLYLPSYAVGRIIGTLAHSTDDPTVHKNAKYGVFFMRNVGHNGDCGDIKYDNYGVFGTTRFVGNASTSYYASSGSVCRADGTWIKGTDGDTYAVKILPEGIEQLSGNIFNSSGNGKSRWVPYAVMCYASDLSTNGIVIGDGFKGYLDTDLFRCALGTYGQTFDNGNFICIDSYYNFLIGWDSGNDPLAGV